jgi:molybdate transport system substrate-binding protein
MPMLCRAHAIRFPAPMRRLAAGLLALACTLPAQAGTVRVAVAANFAAPMARIVAAFGTATGHEVRLTSGASGRFYAQIVAGAPFDVLLAADDTVPARLAAEGHARAELRFTYAIGRLALWSARPGFVDDQGAVLATGRFTHLAIANPKVAPYGAAALQVLRARGLEQTLAPRLVTGESVAQAWQFVSSGNAELGFVAWSQVQQPGRAPAGSHWLVPASLHAPMRQDAVLLKAGEGNAAAVALLDYLKGDAARRLIRDCGYETP